MVGIAGAAAVYLSTEADALGGEPREVEAPAPAALGS